MNTATLPLLDEQSTSIAAAIGDVWPVLLDTVDRSFSRRGAATYARLVGCEDSIRSGSRPLDRGAAMPGFRVVAAVREVELALEGWHRFSTYALTFRLESSGEARTDLRAETRPPCGPDAIVARSVGR
jgi:hypothetical protein